MYRLIKFASFTIFATLLFVSFYGCSATTPNGSASSTTPSKQKQGTFLSHYDLLKPVEGLDSARSWRDPDVNWKQYDKVLIERILIYLNVESKERGIDPTDLKILTDYFYEALVKEIKPTTQIVDTSGPGVLGLRIAITDLMPTNSTLSIAGTLTPYAFIAEASSGPASGLYSLSGGVRHRGPVRGR